MPMDMKWYAAVLTCIMVAMCAFEFVWDSLRYYFTRSLKVPFI